MRLPRLPGTRRTNVALLVLLVLALATGTLAFGFGSAAPGRTVVVAHGVVGVALALLAPAKSFVARRGLRRRRPDRWVSLALAALVVTALVFGFAHAAGAWRLPLGLTTIQVHVGAALLAIAPATWHLLHRPGRPRGTDLSRRSLVRTAAWTSAAAAGFVATEAAWAAAGTRGAQRRFTGSHEQGTDDPARMPVTQWLFDPVPRVDPENWRLEVTGRRRLVLGLDDLEPSEEVRVTIDCTGGWWATQTWSGVRLQWLLAEAGVPEGAVSILVRSVTGYRRRFPMRDADRLWLATHCAGTPLSTGHGAPARLVAPGRRGFWWVKWVDLIAVDDVPAWRQPPFPLQ